MNTEFVKLKAKLLLETLIVLGVMSGTKTICEQFQFIPSGSTGTIGIWLGILVATFFLKKRNPAFRQKPCVSSETNMHSQRHCL